MFYTFDLLQKSERKEDDVENQKKGKVIKFGWIEGVYVSCNCVP